MSERVDPEVIEVDVERPEPEEERAHSRPSGSGIFLGAAGPILAGLVVDLADLVTFHGMGRWGYPIGAGVGWWVAGQLGLRGSRRAWLTVLGALYCGLPWTSHLPLGTLVGLVSGARGRGNSSR